MGTLVSTYENEKEKKYNYDTILHLKINSRNTLNFEMTKEDKLQMIQDGYLQTKEFLDSIYIKRTVNQIFNKCIKKLSEKKIKRRNSF